MVSTRSIAVKRGIFWGYVQTILGSVLPFVLRAVFISNLGSELLGLNSLCTSVLSVLNAVDFGITDAMSYKLYKPIHDNDIEKTCQLYTFFRYIYRGIGLIVLIYGIIFSFFFTKLYPNNDIEINGSWILLVYAINVSLGYFIVSYRYLIFSASQRTDLVHKITTIGFLVLYPLQILMVINKSYLGYLITMLISTVIQYLVGVYYEKKYFNYLYDNKKLSLSEKKDIFMNSIDIIIYKFRNISRNTFDSIVISSFLGLEVLSNYQNYVSIVNVCIIFRLLISSVVTPSLGNYYLENGKKATYSLSKTLLYIQLFASCWIGVFFFFLINSFISIWIGKEYVFNSNVAFLFFIYFIALGVSEFTMMLRQSMGIWKQGRKTALVESIANIILNIVLGHYWGVEGIICATIITILIFCIPCDIKVIVIDFFENSFWDYACIIIKLAIWCAISMIIIGGIRWIFGKDLMSQSLSCILACGIVPFTLFYVLFHKNDDVKIFIDFILEIKKKILFIH